MSNNPEFLMLRRNNIEKTIKVISAIMMVLAIIVAIIGLFVTLYFLNLGWTEYAFYAVIGGIVFAASLVIGVLMFVGSIFLWGFGELVGNSVRMTAQGGEKNSEAVRANDIGTLPSL